MCRHRCIGAGDLTEITCIPVDGYRRFDGLNVFRQALENTWNTFRETSGGDAPLPPHLDRLPLGTGNRGFAEVFQLREASE